MAKGITVGVVGVGFVGKAVAAGFDCGNKIVLVDPQLGTTIKMLAVENPDVVFVCVPTPMGVGGAIDASIVKNVMGELATLLPDTLVLLKSTVTPDIVDGLEKTFPNFVYNPEFLTERNAVADFKNAFAHVFGGLPENTKKAERIYRDYSLSPLAPAYHMSAKEASFVKYGINSFLAAKVMFWNQFFDQCQKSGADYEQVIAAISSDPRIGASHTKIYGDENRRGAAGACFAKDVPAFIEFSNRELSILREAWNANCDLRNSYAERLPREIEQHIEFNKI